MLRTGIVGIGKMGLSHLALARAHDDLDVVAICDSQGFLLSAVKSQTGIAGYKDVSRMFDEQQLDCVFVATPTSSHFDLGMAALESGISPFLEKPLTLSAAQSTALAETATAKGLTNQVGYHNRFIGTFVEAARLVREGAIGDVHHVDGRAFGQVVTKKTGGGGTWRSDKKAGGGCLHDYACHVIDLMNFVVGKPEQVIGAKLSSVYSTGVEDLVNALFVYPNGATGSLETNWSDDSYRKMTTTIEVFGSAGKIVADRQECRLFLRDGHSFEGFEPGWNIRYITELQPPVWFYIRGEEYSAQVDSFARSAAAGATDGVNSFASAAEADWVVEEIASVHAEGRSMVDPRPTEDRPRVITIPRWLDRGIDSVTPRVRLLGQRLDSYRTKTRRVN